MAQTSAYVDITTSDNATLSDAFQFGTAGDVTWSFTAMSFIMEVKASPDDATALLTLSSGAGSIIVDDVVQRVLHLNVPMATLQPALPVACYVYDLIMFDGSSPPIRTPLMHGHLIVRKGITED